MRFNDVGNVMGRLTGRSLPAVSISLNLEAKTTKAAAIAAELARANRDDQRVTRLAALQQQIAEVKGLLDRLQQVSGTTPTVERLRSLVSAIDAEMGQLDDVVRQKVLIVNQREASTAAVTPGTEALSRLLAPLADEIILTRRSRWRYRPPRRRGAGHRYRSTAAAPGHLRGPHHHRHDRDLAWPSTGHPRAGTPGALRDQFRSARDRLLRSLDVVATKSKIEPERLAKCEPPWTACSSWAKERAACSI